MTDCIFCKIASGKVHKDFAYESEDVVAFDDINPLAPIHILIIPRKHIQSVEHVEEGDEKILGEMIFAAKQIAKKRDISHNGYKLLIRTGEHGGQEVPHLHMHLIGGAQLHEEIRPR